MDREFSLFLPKADGGNEELKTNTSFLLIGANGAGKTRLGTWIELNSPQKEKVHRISAQKSLSMPDTTTPTSIDRAEKDLLFGHVDGAWGHKQGHKWGSKPSIFMLNDFQKLMVYLFSDHTEKSAKYLADSRNQLEKVEPPTTKLDIVKCVWETILPHRELILGGLKIQTKVKGSEGNLYNASEMSDGERVIFYLIGQCLAAPEDGIIIIDEPEIHLHKSVQAPLWNELEKLRSDCLFVYLTHDVDFAVSQEIAKKIWLKSYDGQKWEWELIQEIEGLPESLLIEILGNRKPVVFVEGENGSFDLSLYRSVLNNLLVIPRGSCSQVIQSTKALKNSEQLHHLSVYGIIDRDRRVDDEVAALEQHGIYTLEVAEVENLFCTKEILALVSERLSRNVQDDFTSASTFIFGRLNSELENQISLRAASEIKFKLNVFDEKAKGVDALKSALNDLTGSINIDEIYEENKQLLEKVFADKDYEDLLKFYNRKSLSSQISQHLGLTNGELPELVVRLSKGQASEEIRNMLKPYFGAFATHMA
ncbi:MAG: AAA family ATPase [Candidatus Brocadiales bacterium]|nr:AAA family ATPase [Candidatus Brocadiales bacterium]